jgi:uncharacterized membrane protein YfcA
MLLADLPGFALVSAIFFAAGIVKGVLGMGLPTVAMGLLGLLMPVPQAAGLLTVPSIVTNVWQAARGGGVAALVRQLWPFLLGIAAGVAVAGAVPVGDDGLARMLLGACLVLYGVSGLVGWRLPRTPARAAAASGTAVGAITGVITGWTGVFVLPAVPWLQSLGFDRNRLAQALGLSFTTSTAALAALLTLRGQWSLGASLQSALALAPALAGMWAGQLLREEMSEALFRRIFFGGLVALGGWLLLIR